MEDSVDRIAEPWGGRIPHPRHGAWPTRVDTHLAERVRTLRQMRWTSTMIKNISPQLLTSL